MISDVLEYARNNIFVVALNGKVPCSDETSYKQTTLDEAKIREWWTKFPNANVGIQPAKSGFVVLDVDPQNDGDKTLFKLEQQNSPIKTRSVTTGSGGKHFYFKIPNQPLKQKIGFLSGLDLIFDKNHVVAPPSLHPRTKQPYVWDNPTDPINDMPQWLLDLLKDVAPIPQTKPATKPPLPDNLRGRVAHSTREFLDSKGEGGGGFNDRLFKAAKDCQEQGWTEDEFTEAAEKICDYLMPVSVRTIASAFSKEPKYDPRLDINHGVKELVRKCYLVVNLGNKEEARLVDLDTHEEFDVDRANIEDMLSKKEWADYELNNLVYATYDFNPFGAPLLSLKKAAKTPSYNTFIPATWRADSFYNRAPELTRPDIPEIYDRFFSHLTDNQNASKNYLLDWLAASLKGRNFTILTAVGDEGIGKGILGEIMCQLHGVRNYEQASDKVFTTQFNAQLKNKTLVYVDEAKVDDEEAHNKLKAVVNDMIEIEAKNENQKSYRNFASFYLSSNSFTAIRISPGDRRFSVIDLTNTKLFNTKLIEDVEALMSPTNVAELGKYLLQRPVDRRQMLRPFRSARFDELMEASLTNWERWVVIEWWSANAGRIKTLEELQSAIEEKFPKFNTPGRRRIEELVKKYELKLKLRKKGNDWSIECLRKGLVTP